MNENVYQDLYKQLRTEEKELLGYLHSFGESGVSPRSIMSDDIANSAQDTLNQHISFDLYERASNKLVQVRDALVRTKQDDFGNCDICNGPIAADRLEAMPWVTTCIECQTKHAYTPMPWEYV